MATPDSLLVAPVVAWVSSQMKQTLCFVLFVWAIKRCGALAAEENASAALSRARQAVLFLCLCKEC